jgi:hypothetical protein
MGSSRPPAELDTPGKTLWKFIFADFGTEDPYEKHAIRQACRLEDDIVRLRQELLSSKLVVKGSTGQPVESPLLGSIRNAMALQSRLLSTVSVESDAMSPSTAGRRLVALRRTS